MPRGHHCAAITHVTYSALCFVRFLEFCFVTFFYSSAQIPIAEKRNGYDSRFSFKVRYRPFIVGPLVFEAIGFFFRLFKTLNCSFDVVDFDWLIVTVGIVIEIPRYKNFSLPFHQRFQPRKNTIYFLNRKYRAYWSVQNWNCRIASDLCKTHFENSLNEHILIAIRKYYIHTINRQRIYPNK